MTDKELCAVSGWQEQSRDEWLRWCDATVSRKGFADEAERLYAMEVASAGFMAGWRECLSTLRLHGLVK